MSQRSKAVFDNTKPYSPSSITTSQTALLLCDYQNITLAYLGSSAPELLTKVVAARDWALANDILVYHCIVDVNSAPPDHLKMAERWPMLVKKVSADPTLGHEPAQLARKSEKEFVFSRTPGYLSALNSHGITSDLRDRGIKSLLVAGLSTSGCVLSTAKTASEQDFVVTCIEDLCWDPTPGAHDLLVNNVLNNAAHVASFAEVQRIWKQ